MGKKSGPAAPPAPDPNVVSAAQTASNKETAQYQQQLNMVGTQGPTGTTGWRADATQPGGYTQYTNLSAPEQQTYDLSKQNENGALQTAYTQLGRVNDALATPLTTDGLPALQGGVTQQQLQTNLAAPGQIQTSFDKGGQLQYGFDPGQAVQGQVGPTDLNAAMMQAQDAAYGQATSRLDPQFAQAENRERTRLANMGFSENSQGFKDALAEFGRNRTDAYSTAQNQAVNQGNAAAQQLFDRSLAQGNFANTAAGQMYAQNQGQAAFNNATAGQDYGQNRGAAEFANNAQNQGFSQQLAAMQAENAARAQQQGLDTQNAQLGNTARNQGLQERAYIQNQPINQFTGLMSLGQVGQPQGIQYTPSQVGQTDVTGAYALQQQALQANAQRAAQSQSGLMGGLFSLGSAALMASDRRLKKDVRLIRRRRDGVGIYRFRYISGGPEHVGVMAQELKKVRPDLVVRRSDGFMAVNYAGLDLEAA